ncbi:MAG: nucleotide exchange factor GrpE [Oscillospiraceae bacterium]|nr:nucleotide exchange factor GrpE [Oscillospiraceae bacterium]
MTEDKDTLQEELTEDKTAEETVITEETDEDITEETDEDTAEEADEEETEQEDADEALEQERERYLRLFAEFDNFRKRTAREKQEAYGDATARCIGDLLPVVDNFERAVDAPCTDEQYHSGMVMILTQLRNFLEKAGVTEIEALGAEFDPKIHNAIKQTEATEEFPENTVSEVFQKGYMLKERLIRPAMVAVAS